MRSLSVPFDSGGIREYTRLGRQTPGCIVLTLGQPFIDAPMPVRQAAIAALGQGRTGYSPNRGEPGLLQAVARYETEKGYPCQPENIMITAGATGGLSVIFQGLLSAGQEVVMFAPAYPLYRELTQLNGGTPVMLDSTPEGQLPQLQKVIGENTGLIVINSPCNPTGSVLGADSLRRLERAVEGRQVCVVVDAVYRELYPPQLPDPRDFPQLQKKLLICQSFSKTWAMPGFRCGYLTGPPALISRLIPVGAAQVSGVPPFIQDACTVALGLPTHKKVYDPLRRRTVEALTKMGIPHSNPCGGFYLWADIRKFGLADTCFCTRLIREQGLAVVPGSVFGREGFIRICCCSEKTVLEEGMKRLERFVESLNNV